MIWKPGDIAIVDCPESPIDGEIVTILNGPTLRPLHYQYGGTHPTICYEVSYPTPCFGYAGWGFKPNELRPIPPDDEEYDGYEVTSWDDCIFQPKELVRVERAL